MGYAMDVWFFSFTFLLLIHGATAQRVVHGVIKHSVVLPCEIEHNSQSVSWLYNDSKTVCDIMQGEVDFEEQDPAYKDRVGIFRSEIANGNFSIALYNVKESDAGLYDCIAPNIKTVSLELIVKERNHSARTGQADGRLAFLLGSALIYSLTF